MRCFAPCIPRAFCGHLEFVTQSAKMSATIPAAILTQPRLQSVRIVSSNVLAENGQQKLPSSLLEKIAQGDQSAVGQCLDQYGDLVWSLARRFLGNSADIEDAVQEIFIEIWSNAERYKPEIASEVTFIATITRRRLIDRLRKNSRAPDIEEFDEGIARQTPEKIDENLQNVEVQNVVKVLADMPDEQREILTLSIYQGYSHSEIADKLQMPLGTVKTRVRRGLILIREQLEITGPEAQVREGSK